MRTIQILVNDKTSTYEDTKERAEQYLYSNFGFATSGYGFPGSNNVILVEGEDEAGWTAEAQVMRLQSGLLAAEVVE